MSVASEPGTVEALVATATYNRPSSAATSVPIVAQNGFSSASYTPRTTQAITLQGPAG